MGNPKIGAIGERAARVDFTAKKASSASPERGSSLGSKIGRTQSKDGPTSWNKGYFS